ncbi:plastocyanin/azurin family copper-binding protein [Actinoplanes solisilvae]|uniref:plastocyanin/azurin family copper-binding protein n=1 Tax=Actinoplanes solisilvae TaxID=2486853 RepID=UPI00196B76A5|nr:plastocyanin/azurin family copper-binding protein [Actinoplanes solisilvae]
MKTSLVRPHSLAAAAAVLVIAAAGCSSGKGSSMTGTQPPTAGASAPVPAPADLVNIQNFAFNPNTLTVPAKTAVTWKFDDSTDHTVVADDNSFASQPMGNGQTYSHTFATAGTVAYHCSIHPFMKATVTVE